MLKIILMILLIFRPKSGLLYSAFFLGLQILLIGILNILGIKELCSNQELITQELGMSKILINTGASILLLTSYWSKTSISHSR